MTLRGEIISEVYRRLKAAFPDAALEVAEDITEKAPEGSLVLVLMPGPESPWEEAEYDTDDFREFLVGVQIGQASQDGDSSLKTWLAIEETWPEVAAAVEGSSYDAGRLGGLLTARMDRMDVEPSEKPVGGAAVGVQVAWRMRYAYAAGDDT